MNVDTEKLAAATAAVAYVKSGMVVGLGSGSTAGFMIAKLGEKAAKGLQIKGVPSSDKTAALARKVGIELLSLKDAGRLDINIDGADEFNAQLQLIKGGGGALLREKILAHNADFNVIMADASKRVARLGSFKLPIETIPFASFTISAALDKLGLKPQLRMANKQPYVTDENNYIIDLDIAAYEDVSHLENLLLHIPGVVETGLFLKSTDVVLLAVGTEITVLKK